MALKEYTIMLRTDFDTEDKDEIVREAAKTAAKHIYTTALLITDKRKPDVALQCGDLFAEREEILLADDIPGDVTSEGN